MALAKQFYSSFKSYNGWDYYLEIWVEGYSGSASEITLGAGGPVITYGTDEQDRFSSILSSKLELPFMVTNTTEDAFVKNIREQFNEQDVYIHLYRESSSGYSSVAPLWSGFVLMDLSASPDLYYPYPVTLTAVDGLSLLKEIDFVQSGTAGSYTDSDMYSNNGRFTYWIKEILLKSGASTTAEGSTQDYKFTTAINWFNSVMPTITQSTDPFYQTKCNTQMFFSKDANDNFTVVNCYDVLKNLLKHWGARIIYWKHIYYIVQIQEYNTAESGTYANPDNINTRTYTKTGAFDGSSDNLGDSYWTRYNLLIDDVEGGIQKLTGTQFNYLPQLKRTQANFIDYGNKNYFGGLPFDLTTGQTDVIKQATISDVSTDGTMILIIPLDVTMVAQYNGVLSMSLTFRLYITDGVTTYYLRYDPTNTPKYYWEDSSSINLNFKKTIWTAELDNIVGTQTKVGFHQQVDFVDVNGSALTLNGEWDVFTDIDNWGSNNGSFVFQYAITGPFTYTPIYTPSATTIYWTNTLNPTYQSPLNLSIIGTTTQQSYNPNYYNNIGSQNNNIVTYTTSLNQNPFEGKLLIVNTSSSGALYGSFVSVSPSPTTNDSQIVDFGELIWGDTLLASSEGSLKVWNGSSFVKSNVIGTWGLGSTSGTNSFTEMLLSEYLYGQTKVIESPSMRLVIGETNKNQNDGSGSRPNYVNPIGRLKGYSATGTTPYYIFKSGSFHLLKDEIDYQGYQIIRDTQTLTKTDDVIIGPDILQDKTNIIGQKTPQTNSLINKVTQNSFITTTSALKSAYGNDIAVNGIFASDTGWIKGTGWSIASNKASFSPTGSASDIKQDTLTNALTYKIVVSLTLSAGALSVKAGSSGNATVLSASGTYEIFSTCAGSTEVIFEASAAFEGYIEKVVVQQQVPVTSISINAIGEAVFKTNDVLNIADVDGSDVNQFTVSADQGASDTSISVTSKLISEDILEGSIILVNQNDLAAQYQNKTKGTVGGFDITANSIDSGSVSIESYIDDDTFATASATSLATSESIKAYVDTQVGSADTLQEVTDNGNTTTNSITFAGGTTTNVLQFTGGYVLDSVHSLRLDSGTGQPLLFSIADSEKMRLTSDGRLGIGTTSPNHLLDIESASSAASLRLRRVDNNHQLVALAGGSYSYVQNPQGALGLGGSNDNRDVYIDTSGNVGINQVNPSEKLHVVGDALITGDSHADAFKPAVSGNPIKFKRYDGNEVGRFKNNGYFGINVSDPQRSLDIGGAVRVLNENQIEWGWGGVKITGSVSTNTFKIGTWGGSSVVDRMTVETDGQLNLSSYGSGSFTGTETYFLAVTSGGDVVEADSSALPGGPYLPLSGGTLTGSLTGTTATLTGTLELSNGTLNSTTARLSLKSEGSYVQLKSNNNVIYYDATSHLFRDNSGSEKMRILSNGRIGIGTASPNAALDIQAGTADFRLTSTGQNRTALANTSTGFQISQIGNKAIYFETNGSERMRLNSTGLGIGTSSPSEKLEVDGNIQVNGSMDSADGLHLKDRTFIAFSDESSVVSRFRSSSTGVFQFQDGSYNTGIELRSNGRSYFSNGIDIKNNGNANLTLSKTDNDQKLELIGGNGGVQMIKSSYELAFYRGGSEKMRLTTNGLLIGTTTDVGVPLYVNGVIRAVGGGIQAAQDYGFTLNDESGSNRYGLKFGAAGTVGGSNLLMLTNRSFNSATGGGEVAIGGNTNTSGVTEVEIARFIPRVTATSGTQKKVSLDAVLELTEQTAPADPASGESIIWMDSSSGDLKVKINFGGTTVTRTLASFE